jgi:hypothetical protein
MILWATRLHTVCEALFITEKQIEYGYAYKIDDECISKTFNLSPEHKQYIYEILSNGNHIVKFVNRMDNKKELLNDSIEIVISKDENGDLVGLSLLPFDAIKYATVNNISYFISKNHKKKFIFFKIPTCHYIEFDLKKLELENKYFKKLFCKLRNLDKSIVTEYLLNDKMKSKFNYDAWIRRQEFLILQYPHKIGWYGRHSSNKLLSESYLLYRSVKYKLFRQKCLKYLLQSINDALKVISDEIGASGEIIVTIPLIDYKHEWQRYVNGELSASELSNIIYRV